LVLSAYHSLFLSRFLFSANFYSRPPSTRLTPQSSVPYPFRADAIPVVCVILCELFSDLFFPPVGLTDFRSPPFHLPPTTECKRTSGGRVLSPAFGDVPVNSSFFFLTTLLLTYTPFSSVFSSLGGHYLELRSRFSFSRVILCPPGCPISCAFF